MKRENQNKCYRTRVVTLITVFKNIYQIFLAITILKYMSVISAYVAYNYCLINTGMNTLTTLLRWIFILRIFKAKTRWKVQCRELQLCCFIKRGRNLFSAKIIHQRKHMWEKKRQQNIVNRASMKVNLPVEVNRENNLNKINICKIVSMT